MISVPFRGNVLKTYPCDALCANRFFVVCGSEALRGKSLLSFCFRCVLFPFAGWRGSDSKNNHIFHMAIAYPPRTHHGMIREQIDSQGVRIRIDKPTRFFYHFIIFLFCKKCFKCRFLDAHGIFFKTLDHFVAPFVFYNVIDDEDDVTTRIFCNKFIFFIIHHRAHLRKIGSYISRFCAIIACAYCATWRPIV